MLPDDAQWLEQYVREGSEPAFRKIVERYLALVNATARRMTNGNVHLAQDITQLVFTDLARKAASLPRGVILGGWLHRHTCYTALKALRSENRRHQRERIAMELTAINENSGQDAHWLELAPVLDEALNRLGTRDREVIVLRYFQQQDIRSIGHDLGASETAVQKRLGRALEKLRAILARRGVTLASATVLGSALDAGVITSVPTGLVATVSTTAVGTAAVASTGLTLLTLKTMTTSKLALALAAAVVLAGSTTAVISHYHAATTPKVAPLVASTVPPAKTAIPQIVSTPKVEAPKLAPAPAGDKPALPDDVASGSASLDSSTTKNPLNVIVIGSVSSPGWTTIPADQKPTLVAAIAQAHGPSSDAAGTVTITRKLPDGSTAVFKDVDLYNAVKGTGPDFPLQDGDTITIGAQAGGVPVWK